MAYQAEPRMARHIWTFFDSIGVGAVRDEALRAVLGYNPPTTLHCWKGSTPGADLVFADKNDVLRACVELKRRNSPSQYSSVRHIHSRQPFFDHRGRIDPVSLRIYEAARSHRTDKHYVEDDTCTNARHTQLRRDKDGKHTWFCGIPQIDLYRGFCHLPGDGESKVIAQDPVMVRWVLISDDKRPIQDRYPGTQSAGCWISRSWDAVFLELGAAADILQNSRIRALRDSLESLRGAASND